MSFGCISSDIKVSSLKGENLLSWCKFSPFRVDPFSETGSCLECPPGHKAVCEDR